MLTATYDQESAGVSFMNASLQNIYEPFMSFLPHPYGNPVSFLKEVTGANAVREIGELLSLCVV